MVFTESLNTDFYVILGFSGFKKEKYEIIYDSFKNVTKMLSESCVGFLKKLEVLKKSRFIYIGWLDNFVPKFR